MRFPFSISLMLSNSETSTVQVKSMTELADFVCKHNWSPSLFSDNHRLIATFVSCDVIGLDVDDRLSLDEAKKKFADYSHLIIPTKSHQMAKNGIVADRYRVILFLERQITSNQEFRATWASLYGEFPFIDNAAKDCARMFYRCPHNVESLNATGKMVKVVAPTQTASPVTPDRSSTIGVRGKLSYSTLKFMNEGAQNGAWNDTLYKAAKDYQQNGRPIDEFIEDANKITGRLDATDLRTIESAYKNEPIYEARTDFADGLRKKILSSNLIVNQEDSRDTFLVDTKTGQTMNVDLQNIRAVLKNDTDHYMSSKRVIASICYEPHQHRILWADDQGLYFYNSYRPPTWKKHLFFGGELESAVSLPEIYQKFLLHLTAGDKPSYEYLLDWLALSLRCRNLTILTAIGEEGIGKGILGEIMEDVHGPTNFTKVRDNVFKEKFNAPFENRTLVYVDEIKITKRESLDRIKDVVNWQIEIEKKGIDPKSVTNHASFYLSSNSFDAIPIEPGQRRFSIIQLTDVKLKDSELVKGWPTIQQLVDDLRSSPNIHQLAAYLYHRPIDRKKMLDPFISERALEVKEAGLREWEFWVIFDWCKSQKNPYTQIPLRELQIAIGERFPKLSQIGRRPIEELAKKFPEVFLVKKVIANERATRFIELVTSPTPSKSGGALTAQENEVLDNLARPHEAEPPSRIVRSHRSVSDVLLNWAT